MRRCAPLARSVPLSAVVAAAAKETGRPVRLMLDRDEDMLVSGWRHPFLGRYIPRPCIPEHCFQVQGGLLTNRQGGGG